MLTPKQESFCLAYLETGNASEAYRRSYAASNMSSTSINRSAKELLDNPKIAARLAVVRASAAQSAEVTLVRHLGDLKELREEARAAGQFSPAIQAEIARGKVSGFYVDRVAGHDGGALKLGATVIILPDNGRNDRDTPAAIPDAPPGESG